MSRRGGHVSSRGRGATSLAGSTGLDARPASSPTSSNKLSSIGGNGVSLVGGAGFTAATSRNKQLNDSSRRISEYSSPDDRCPQCRTDRFLNPKLRLLVSPCYHKMCESCIDRIFSLGPAPCPVCAKNCRKNQFSAQRFQDLGVEREVDIRSTIGRLFNKRENDFDNLMAYNDYLEEAESLMFNLVNKIDVQETNARIQRYEQVNRNNIATNVKTAFAESEAARAREEDIRVARQARASRRREREARERSEKEQEERALVEALAGRGDLSVDTVIQRRNYNTKKRQETTRQEEKAEEEAERHAELALGLRRSSPMYENDRMNSRTVQKVDHPTWTMKMVYDFAGPLAALSNAEENFDVRRHPPSRSTPGSVEATYLDPWALSFSIELVELFRVGGWNHSLDWTRSLRSANEGIGLLPAREN